MEFYYWILIIIIILNAIIMFTSFGEYIKELLTIERPMTTNIMFGLLAFSIILLAFWFLIAKG